MRFFFVLFCFEFYSLLHINGELVLPHAHPIILPVESGLKDIFKVDMRSVLVNIQAPHMRDNIIIIIIIIILSSIHFCILGYSTPFLQGLGNPILPHAHPILLLVESGLKGSFKVDMRLVLVWVFFCCFSG